MARRRGRRRRRAGNLAGGRLLTGGGAAGCSGRASSPSPPPCWGRRGRRRRWPLASSPPAAAPAPPPAAPDSRRGAQGGGAQAPPGRAFRYGQRGRLRLPRSRLWGPLRGACFKRRPRCRPGRYSRGRAAASGRKPPWPAPILPTRKAPPERRGTLLPRSRKGSPPARPAVRLSPASCNRVRQRCWA
ncbi:collagen alpha-1(I) chain-like [Rhineura floridana]|uniref:collagen alpha-1(I) chain-like n=1 Tax=Rhineura floridana TaxID=261503 RepID=UPI002AC82D45|nr:collagen alpha-1(I) chain-like [Rhineura floridana]